MSARIPALIVAGVLVAAPACTRTVGGDGTSAAGTSGSATSSATPSGSPAPAPVRTRKRISGVAPCRLLTAAEIRAATRIVVADIDGSQAASDGMCAFNLRDVFPSSTGGSTGLLHVWLYLASPALQDGGSRIRITIRGNSGHRYTNSDGLCHAEVDVNKPGTVPDATRLAIDVNVYLGGGQTSTDACQAAEKLLRIAFDRLPAA